MAKLFNQKVWILKKFSFFFSFFLLILFLFYPFSTSAGPFDPIIAAVTAVPYIIIGAILIFIIILTQAFAWVMGSILDLVISPDFVSFSFTNPDNNPIIKAGLSITQNFVNILLVMALVYTALSIALRINERESKRMLARLIVVALLVNFAPVLCGLVVDGANIVMNHFLEPIQGGISGFFTQIGSKIKDLINLLIKSISSVSQQLGALMMAITQIIINIMMGVAFLLFAIIFLVRYIAIWVLVILAPIAFASWVFPKEGPSGAWELIDIILLPLRILRGFWNMWLNNFIQWSIIGIPTAFFLFLAMNNFSLINEAFQPKIKTPEPEVSGFFDGVFPYLVVLIFLYLGFTISLQTTAMGGAAIISVSKSIIKRTGRWGGRAARRGAGAVLGAKGKEFLKEQAKARFMPQKLSEMKGIKGTLLKGGYMVLSPFAAGPIWAIRRGLGEAGLRLVEAERRDIRQAEEVSKGTMAERKLAGIRDNMRVGKFKEAAGILRQGIEEGQIGDLKKLGLSNEEIIKLGRSALSTHPDEFKLFRDAFPLLAEKMGEKFPETIKQAAGIAFKDQSEATQYGSSIAAMIVAKMKPANIPKMDIGEIFSRKDTEAAIHQFWTGEQVGTAARIFGRAFIEPFMEMVQKNGRNFYHDQNPRLEAYLDSSAAKGLGLGLPKEKEEKERQKR